MSKRSDKYIDEIGFLGTNLSARFFFHWSILSGATLILIVPLVFNILGESRYFVLVNFSYFKLSVLFLMMSLILSSMRNLIYSKGLIGVKTFNLENNEEGRILISRRILKWSKIRRLIEYISIISYIIGMSLLYIFLWPIF